MRQAKPYMSAGVRRRGATRRGEPSGRPPVISFTNPSGRPAATAGSTAVIGSSATWPPRSATSSSLIPTRATSGSQKVTQAMADEWKR